MGPSGSDLGYALLGLLEQAPRSGYELRRIFATTPLAHFSDSPGAIYPALRRLRSRGWIEPVPSEKPSGRRKETLRPTAAGRRAFREWLLRPVSVVDLVHATDRLILRFAFMGEALPPGRGARFLESFRDAARRHFASLLAFFEREGPAMPVTGRLAFQRGLLGVENDIRWAEAALRTMRGRRATTRRRE